MKIARHIALVIFHVIVMALLAILAPVVAIHDALVALWFKVVEGRVASHYREMRLWPWFDGHSHKGWTPDVEDDDDTDD